MRNVICAFNITIDGCYDHTKVNGSEELLEYFTSLMKDVGVSVTGRKMYELMSPYWNDVAKNQSGTTAANDFAKTFTAIDTIVVSRTITPFEGGPRIIRDDVEGEIRRLKAMEGKKITIGGMTLRSQLMALGLIDELYLVIHPVIVGSGPRLFGDINLNESIKMDLVGSKVMQSGCMALHYVKRVE